MERTFDRVARFDERSRSFPARTLVEATEPRSYTWGVPTQDGMLPLDQGVEGACVGHGWAHEAAARPVVRRTDSALAFQVYREAKKIDYWPGEDYEGTSVLAGAKIMQRLGYIESYRWAFSLQEALTVTSRHGPAVLGLNWYEGMFEPDAKGYLHATGKLLGGHCLLLSGNSNRFERATVYNSWGADWGMRGRAYISWEDLERLLAEDGECCIPVGRVPA